MQNIPPIKSVMTQVPQTLSVGESIRTALGIMEVHEIHHLPVVDGTEVIGLVSQRDLLNAVATADHASFGDDIPVEQACTIEKYAVDPDDPLDSVLDEMARRHIGSALVLQSGQLLGIFTVTDACKIFAKALRGETLSQL